MNTLPNPDSWMDVAAYVLIGVFMLLIAAVPTWLNVRNNKGIRAIKDQVVNGHSTALREDLDRAIRAIEHLSDDVARFRVSISDEVAHLRVALTDEEARRRNHIEEVRSDFSDLRNKMKGQN